MKLISHLFLYKELNPGSRLAISGHRTTSAFFIVGQYSDFAIITTNNAALHKYVVFKKTEICLQAFQKLLEILS